MTLGTGPVGDAAALPVLAESGGTAPDGDGDGAGAPGPEGIPAREGDGSAAVPASEQPANSSAATSATGVKTPRPARRPIWSVIAAVYRIPRLTPVGGAPCIGNELREAGTRVSDGRKKALFWMDAGLRHRRLRDSARQKSIPSSCGTERETRKAAGTRAKRQTFTETTALFCHAVHPRMTLMLATRMRVR